MPRLNGEGNRLLTTDKVANDMLLRWKNNLVLTKSVYRDLEGQFGEIGDTISVKLPNNVIVNDGRIATKTTPLNDKTVSLTINMQKNVKFSWNMKDRKLSILQFGERYLEPAANRLANEVDMSIAREMILAYTPFGTVGQPLKYTDVTLGRAYARDIAIPDDALVRLIVNTIDWANISNGLSTVQQQNIVRDAIIKGYAGELAGFDMFYSQNIITHTNGTFSGTEQVATDLSDGDQLQISGGAASATIKKGDRFTIAGVKEINPITKQITGRLQTFVVREDVTLDSMGRGTLKIYPRINDGSGTTVDKAGNVITTEMDKSVEGRAISGAAINFIGQSNATYRENYIMHRNAIAMAFVFLDLPASGHGSRARDKQTGLSISVSEYFNGDKNENNLRMDILWGVKMVRPDLIMRATCQKIG